jgi:oligoribonuclease
VTEPRGGAPLAPYAVPVTANSTGGSGDRIVWIDCEMTGLDTTVDALVEVAAIVTDSELNVLGDGVDVVIRPPDAALEQMGDFVRQMHTTSGLLADLPHGTTLADAEERVLAYLREWIPDAGRAPLAGNSIGTDKAYLDRDMPALMEHLHYRVIDVSSIKELARRWYPRVYFASPAKTGGHRALADILESIDELRYYRAALLVPQPGPDSTTARSIAAKVAATSVARTLGGSPSGAGAGSTIPAGAPDPAAPVASGPTTPGGL